MYGQKFGPKLVQPLRIERNRNGKEKKPKLDNARKMRGIYFIDHDDQEYKETLINARRKLDVPKDAARPCKRKARTSTTMVAAKQEIVSQKIPKTIHG